MSIDYRTIDPNLGTAADQVGTGGTTPQYFDAAAALDQSNPGGAVGAAPAAAVANAPVNASTGLEAGATGGDTAGASISATLSGLGLGGMTDWATTYISSLVGKGMSPTDAVNTAINQMNNPVNADGSVNQSALDAFNAALPGFNQRITTTGNNGSPGASAAEAIASYITYNTQIKQFEQQALIPGTIDATTIGNLWANNVSTSEVSQRITDATVAATSAPKEVQDYLSANYGMSPSALASYYLNPNNTMQTITQNMNSAMVGGESAITGFGKDMSVAQSQALGAFLANGASGGNGSQIGQVNALTAGDANSFFTRSLSSATTGAVNGSLAQLSGFEGATPGQNGTVTADQLIAAGEGSAQDINAVSNAQQTRRAGALGGGGATTTANGAVGLGFANS